MPGLKLKNPDFIIQENSWLAKIAARKLKSTAAAIVAGKTIHLHNITRQQLLQDERLLQHELCHVRQYQQYGNVVFVIKYLWESCRKGYYHNKFEVQARAAENL